MRLLLILTLVCLTSITAKAQPDQAALDLFDSALAQAGMTTDDVRFDAAELGTYQGDRFLLSYFSLLHANLFKLPQHGALNLETFRTEIGNITSLTAHASRLIDHPIRRSLIGDPLEPYLVFPDSLPGLSIMRHKNVLTGSEYKQLREGIDLIYRMCDDDDFLFKRGIKKANKEKFRKRLFDYFINENEEYQDLIYELVEKIDFDYFLAGAQDFAEAVRRLARADSLTFPEKRREIKTAKGLIVIGSAGDDIYDYYTPPLMIIDGSGNDTYRFGGYPDDYPLAIIIDYAGDDQYLSTDSTKPGIGGAVLGMSIVMDMAGNDRYEGVNVTQGGAIFGVGILWDGTGDDLFTARTMAQGAATFGLGILADSTGNDSLFCLQTSQGFGYTQGCGLLLNFDGDDKYVADDSNIVNPSAQTKEHNSSLAQGVGFGKRADYLDGHSWAGGVGILCDMSGDDQYSAGLFAQGCAYWRAVGMLLDGDGADQYRGIWYVQGSGAHFGVGYLDDFAGDDRYVATNNMAIGAGHDFTIGYFNERGGNDDYTVPNLSLGGGNAAGIGIFHDHSGDDNYHTKGGTTLGRANSSYRGIRKFLYCFGIFIDGAGDDTYSEPWAGNNRRWLGPQSDTTKPSAYSIGVGIDR
jgi:hypothetical protein